ncbi:MAG: hypothetical protein V4508_18700 [Pseudomonadota bacterium]
MTRLTEAPLRETEVLRAAGAPRAPLCAVLPMNLCLAVGQAIVSANGVFCARIDADGRLRVYRGDDADCLWESARSAEGGRFFALVQSDANFCIYRGEDLAHNEGWHWGTQMTAEGSLFHAHLQDDGEFCICRGAGPDDCQGTVWRSGARDPLERLLHIEAIDYQLGQARLVQSRPSDLYRETVNNPNLQVQTSMVSGSVTVSDTTGWSDSLALAGETVPAYRGPVPVVCGGRVQLSGDSGHAYIRNGAATTAKTWGFNAPAAVPPRSAMMCLVAAMRSAIVVPYTLRGRFTLRSGRQVEASVRGSYTGANCHDLSVTLSTYDPDPAGSYSIRRPLTPMPAIAGAAVPHPIGAAAFY